MHDPVRSLVISAVVNPAAGRASAALAGQVSDVCARHGAGPVRFLATEAPGHAARLAGAEAAGASTAGDRTLRVILAVGGDGTAHEVACGLLEAGADPRGYGLFILPAGTGNSGYRGLWDQTPWPEALARALARPAGHLRTVDLARHGESGRPVFLGAGAGLTAAVLEHAVAADAAPGRLQAGLERALGGFRPYPGRVTVDGRVLHEGPTLFANVGGGRFRAWQYEVLPHSRLDDGLLDVCVAGPGIGVGFSEFQDMLRAGAHPGLPDVHHSRGRHVVIERTDGEQLCFEHDGNLVADPGPRATLDVLPAALPVFCDPAVIAGREPLAAAAGPLA